MSMDKHDRCLIAGIVLVLIGVFFSFWTPSDIVWYERIHMRKWSFSFMLWHDPPDSVDLHLYFFNVTNHEAFLNGSAAKLHLKEIGPLVFTDQIVHVGTTFNENNTLTYGTKHNFIFEPEKNTIDLDSVLVLPNYPLLASAAVISEKNVFLKLVFHGVYRTLKPNLFVNTTIRGLLWNYSEPFMNQMRELAPSFVFPQEKEVGLMTLFSPPNVKNITVRIGPENGHKNFFNIDNFDGSNYLPGYGNECNLTLENASESLYPQYLNRSSILRLFKDNICRFITLYYEGDDRKYGISAYRFGLPKTTFDRTLPLEDDCFKGNPVYPNGIADMSKCASDVPLALSFPHFLHSNFPHPIFTGYRPNATKHATYVLVEPVSGAPLESLYSIQLNLFLGNLKGVDSSLKIFKNSFVPICWFQAKQGMVWYIAALTFFSTTLLPVVQVVLTVLMMSLGVFLIYLFWKNLKRKRLDTNNEGERTEVLESNSLSDNE